MEAKDYNKQARDFLNKTGVTMKIKFLYNGNHFDDEKEKRDVYRITISKGTRSYTFKFGCL